MAEFLVFLTFGYICYIIGRAGGPSRRAYIAGYEDGFNDASEIVVEELGPTGPRPA